MHFSSQKKIQLYIKINNWGDGIFITLKTCHYGQFPIYGK